MTSVKLLAVLLVALSAVPLARANTCPGPVTVFHPGWLPPDDFLAPALASGSPSPAVPVGRLCTIQVHTPAAGDGRLRPEDLSIHDGTEEIPFTASAAVAVTLERGRGCDQARAEVQPIAYEVYVLSFPQPLPARREVRVRRKLGGQPLVYLPTSDRLDREGCEPHPAPPRLPHCLPPRQECPAPDGGASPPDGGSRGGGCSMAAAPSAGALIGATILGLAVGARRRRRRRVLP